MRGPGCISPPTTACFFCVEVMEHVLGCCAELLKARRLCYGFLRRQTGNPGHITGMLARLTGRHQRPFTTWEAWRWIRSSSTPPLQPAREATRAREFWGLGKLPSRSCLIFGIPSFGHAAPCKVFQHRFAGENTASANHLRTLDTGWCTLQHSLGNLHPAPYHADSRRGVCDTAHSGGPPVLTFVFTAWALCAVSDTHSS